MKKMVTLCFIAVLVFTLIFAAIPPRTVSANAIESQPSLTSVTITSSYSSSTGLAPKCTWPPQNKSWGFYEYSWYAKTLFKVLLGRCRL